uniref:NADH-ubiquinone oxidoreductase chain 4L n=1 Tax=Xystodesmus sp. YD-2016 TaxID=1904352 RepID=A0A1S5RSA1_9MYRI|nr:NADH dehydrogenase subunit 4L [Xystodesmus sp. YD-2016]
MMMFSLVILFGGFIGLLGSYRRVLNVLLSFEMIMLGLLSLLGVWLSFSLGDLIFMFCFIVFMVGEGVLGLSILVSLIRGYGEDSGLGLGVMVC